MKKSIIFNSLPDIQGMEPVSAALGFFDGLHPGHAEVIKSSLLNKYSLKSAVFTFNSMSGLPKMSGSGCILSNELKISLIEKMGIDYIISLDFDEIMDYSPEHFVTEVLSEKLNAKAVNCGTSFKFGKNCSGNTIKLKELCRKADIAVNIVPAVKIFGKTISSTGIRHLVEIGDIAAANAHLGYDYMFESEVIRGEMFGRTIGIPTINQVIPAGNVLPKFGVYKSYTTLGNRHFKSLTNIGVKPTVSDGKMPLAETYIVGYNGDLYGQTVRISLIDYMRGEKKFNSIYELRAQIERDIKEL